MRHSAAAAIVITLAVPSVLIGRQSGSPAVKPSQHGEVAQRIAGTTVTVV